MANLIKFLDKLPKAIRREFLRQKEELDLETVRFLWKGKNVKGTLFSMEGQSYIVVSKNSNNEPNADDYPELIGM